MSKNKNNRPIWKSRIQKTSKNLFEKVGSSLKIDKRLYDEDIMASSVHVEMLFKQKIIDFKIKYIQNLFINMIYYNKLIIIIFKIIINSLNSVNDIFFMSNSRKA